MWLHRIKEVLLAGVMVVVVAKVVCATGSQPLRKSFHIYGELYKSHEHESLSLIRQIQLTMAFGVSRNMYPLLRSIRN